MIITQKPKEPKEPIEPTAFHSFSSFFVLSFIPRATQMRRKHISAILLPFRCLIVSVFHNIIAKCCPSKSRLRTFFFPFQFIRVRIALLSFNQIWIHAIRQHELNEPKSRGNVGPIKLNITFKRFICAIRRTILRFDTKTSANK